MSLAFAPFSKALTAANTIEVPQRARQKKAAAEESVTARKALQERIALERQQQQGPSLP